MTVPLDDVAHPGPGGLALAEALPTSARALDVPPPPARPLAEEPWARVLAEEPWASPLAEEPWARALVEEPWARVLAEEPSASPLAEEPWARALAEEPWARALKSSFHGGLSLTFEEERALAGPAAITHAHN